ncbi:phosphosulfolactate synthase [Bosea sp. 117]|uniref:phosphosulfolactate synthase n=1 Tax=Bosea sp. 117 TaxID=1125973 RepID=UPI0004942814|nr:phosphosulfolactate synthase [Bosea sp. 117]
MPNKKNPPASVAADPFAFSFIRMAPRPARPRESGLTIIGDRGVGLARTADLIESAGDHIDFFKFGMGTYRVMRPDFIRRKVAMLKEAGIRVFFAGDITEAAFMQGVSKRFYAEVKAFGADAVEVSSAQVAMPLEDKCRLIGMARDAGLEVVAEAGQKGAEDWTRSVAYIARQIEAYQKAGAWKVLVQADGISEDVETSRWDVILNIAARFDIKDLIFQAKDSAAQKWYVGTLGNAVNLDVEDHQVIELELARRGIRGRHIFGLVGSLETN